MGDLFKIYTINADDAAQIAALPNEIHQHDFEELIIGIQGQITHFIDFKSQTYDAPFVSFVSKGKVHRAQPLAKDGKCDFWVLRFKSEFIPETTFHLYASYHEQATLSFNNDSCFKRLALLCQLMQEEMLQPHPDLAVIQKLLSALFTMVESERKKQHPELTTLLHTQNITFQNFLQILEENFRRPEGVAYYAEKLFMSVRNLNNICQNIFQQSVSDIIETRKLIEAKNLLMTTDLPIASIGYELGYSDKAHFSAVFKKKAGQTPTAFRAEMKNAFQ